MWIVCEHRNERCPYGSAVDPRVCCMFDGLSLDILSLKRTTVARTAAAGLAVRSSPERHVDVHSPTLRFAFFLHMTSTSCNGLSWNKSADGATCCEYRKSSCSRPNAHTEILYQAFRSIDPLAASWAWLLSNRLSPTWLTAGGWTSLQFQGPYRPHSPLLRALLH